MKVGCNNMLFSENFRCFWIKISIKRKCVLPLVRAKERLLKGKCGGRAIGELTNEEGREAPNGRPAPWRVSSVSIDDFVQAALGPAVHMLQKWAVLIWNLPKTVISANSCTIFNSTLSATLSEGFEVCTLKARTVDLDQLKWNKYHRKCFKNYCLRKKVGCGLRGRFVDLRISQNAFNHQKGRLSSTETRKRQYITINKIAGLAIKAT